MNQPLCVITLLMKIAINLILHIYLNPWDIHLEGEALNRSFGVEFVIGILGISFLRVRLGTGHPRSKNHSILGISVLRVRLGVGRPGSR